MHGFVINWIFDTFVNLIITNNCFMRNIITNHVLNGFVKQIHFLVNNSICKNPFPRKLTCCLSGIFNNIKLPAHIKLGNKFWDGILHKLFDDGSFHVVKNVLQVSLINLAVYQISTRRYVPSEVSGLIY